MELVSSQVQKGVHTYYSLRVHNNVYTVHYKITNYMAILRIWSHLLTKSLRIHWWFSMILKTRKELHEVMFFDMKKYVYSETNFLRTKKSHLFSFASLQLLTVLLQFAILIWVEAQGSSLYNGMWDFPFSTAFCFCQSLYICSKNTWIVWL